MGCVQKVPDKAVEARGGRQNGLRVTMTHHRYAYTRMTRRTTTRTRTVPKIGNVDETWVEWMAWLCRVVLGSGEARPADDKMELSGVK